MATTDTTSTLTQQTEKSDTASIPSYKSTGFQYDLSKPLNYPLTNKSDHFVRFWINLDEESRMFTSQKLTVLGIVDQTDQNRLRRKPINQDTFEGVAGVAGAAAAAAYVSKLRDRQIRQFAGNQSSINSNEILSKGDMLFGGIVGGVVAASIAKEVKIDKKLKRLATSITLYTPSTITNSQQTRWDNYADVIGDILQAVGSPDDIAKSLTGSSTATTMDRVSEVAGRAKSTIGMAARVVGTEASGLLASATRSAVNPKTDLLFKSIERRTFSFDYVFAPKTEREAKEVAYIIQAFRLFSAPEVVQGSMEYLYTFPAEFDIEYGFRKDNKEEQNKFLNKISSCVLETVSINYSPGGSFQTLENGEPVQCSMSLHFRELETLHRDRIAAGY